MYEIWDIKEKRRVGTPYKARQRARTRADKLDLEYGAIRYIVRLVTQDNNLKT
jgi:hypothetical protein